jgi:hypothetical protein
MANVAERNVVGTGVISFCPLSATEGIHMSHELMEAEAKAAPAQIQDGMEGFARGWKSALSMAG